MIVVMLKIAELKISGISKWTIDQGSLEDRDMISLLSDNLP